MKNSSEQDQVITCLYVYDLLVTSSNENGSEKFKENMENEFEMSYIRNLAYFLGMEIVNPGHGVLLHQKKYEEDILKKLKMRNFKHANTPMKTNIKLNKESKAEMVDITLYNQIIGSLRYFCNTRPDICHSARLISIFMENLSLSHLIAAKTALRYIRGTVDHGVLMPNQ